MMPLRTVKVARKMRLNLTFNHSSSWRVISNWYLIFRQPHSDANTIKGR